MAEKMKPDKLMLDVRQADAAGLSYGRWRFEETERIGKGHTRRAKRQRKKSFAASLRGMPMRHTAIPTHCAASTPIVWKNCSTAQFLSTEKSTRINSHETGDAPGNAAASTRSSTKP